jgi:hypothetical protein
MGGLGILPGREPWVPSGKFRVFIFGMHSLLIFNPTDISSIRLDIKKAEPFLALLRHLGAFLF